MNGNGNTTLEIRNEPTLLEISGILAPPSSGTGDLVPVNPHEVLIGPATGSAQALPFYRLITASDIPFASTLTADNVFTNVNRIPGLRLGTRVITVSYTLTALDYAVLANATSAQIDVQLPAALGTGQIYRLKKDDTTVNLVNLKANGADLIDTDSYVPLRNYKDEIMVRDAVLGRWDRYSPGITTPPDLSDIATLSSPNEFLAVNTFNGLCLTPRLINTTGSALSDLDTEVIVDATAADIEILLKPSSASGQWYHIKKIDTTSHVVSVVANGSDLIDGAISVNMDQQFAECTLLDALVGYWDNVGAGPELTPPSVFQIGRWARFVEINAPNGIQLELFNGTSWVVQWKQTI
jgi:hypothetical protein